MVSTAIPDRRLGFFGAVVIGLIPMELEFLNWYAFETNAQNLLPGIAALALILAYPTWLGIVARMSHRIVLPALLALVPSLMLIPDFFGYLPKGRGSDIVDWGGVIRVHILPLVILAIGMVAATSFAAPRSQGQQAGGSV